MNHRTNLWRWLVQDWNWPVAVLFTSGFLVVLLPVMGGTAGVALTLVFTQLPIYMLHQWEEHDGDRFRSYVNETLLGGREGLDKVGTFWINALGVWGLDLVALYLAWGVDLRYGLIAAYLTVFNGISHMGMALRGRAYNPGLVTSLVLFLPIGGWCLVAIGQSAGLIWHLLGLGVVIGLHGAIVVYVVSRLALLKKSAGDS